MQLICLTSTKCHAGQVIAMSAKACHIPAIAALVALPTLERASWSCWHDSLCWVQPISSHCYVNARPDGRKQKSPSVLSSLPGSKTLKQHLFREPRPKGFGVVRCCFSCLAARLDSAIITAVIRLFYNDFFRVYWFFMDEATGYSQNCLFVFQRQASENVSNLRDNHRFLVFVFVFCAI